MRRLEHTPNGMKKKKTGLYQGLSFMKGKLAFRATTMVAKKIDTRLLQHPNPETLLRNKTRLLKSRAIIKSNVTVLVSKSRHS